MNLVATFSIPVTRPVTFEERDVDELGGVLPQTGSDAHEAALVSIGRRLGTPGNPKSRDEVNATLTRKTIRSQSPEDLSEEDQRAREARVLELLGALVDELGAIDCRVQTKFSGDVTLAHHELDGG